MPEPLFTPGQIVEDAQNRVARTVGQVTVPSAIITVGDYLLQHYAHQEALPPAVVLALGVIGAAITAMVTNRKKLKGQA